MLASILSMVGSAVAGGATGLIGTIGTKVLEYKTRKEELKFELEHRKVDIEEIKLETERDIAVSNIEADAQRDVAASNIQIASYDSDKAKYGDKLWFVDMVRGFMRPLITLYMLSIMTWLAIVIHQSVSGIEAMSAEQVLSLWVIIIDAVIYLTTTAVTWWFGSRPSSPRKA